MICERCKLTTADAELARNAGMCAPCRSEQDLAVLAKWELELSDPPAVPHVDVIDLGVPRPFTEVRQCQAGFLHDNGVIENCWFHRGHYGTHRSLGGLEWVGPPDKDDAVNDPRWRPSAEDKAWVAYDGTQEMMDGMREAGRRAVDHVVAQATKATTGIYHTAAEESVAAVPIRAIRLVNNTSAAVRARFDYDGDVLVVTIEQ